MKEPKKLSTRRHALQSVGGLGAVALLGWACSDDGSTGGSGGSDGEGGSGGIDGSGGAGGSPSVGGSGGAGAAGSPGTGGEGGAAQSGDWATGGTQVMDGKDYGNPFEDGVGPTCNVYASSTEGPCHAPSPTRKDVSEGYPGLPMRLELLIVDADCNPVPNAEVEIWHCDTLGVYSGDIDGNNDDFCTGGDEEAAAASWYRGIQTAGSDGRVTFDTNFPGWYGGRATHIHFRVTVGNTQYMVSQLFFDEDLKVEIYNSQPNYEPTSGQGYQPNAGDNVIQESGLEVSEVVCSTAKQSDGAMLAWKAITINA
ncbi:MAG: protocatechuate 3,4-dioxygenase [Polyangiaceae bacterium]|nr:protocatechuate 3,4-dioxygenase [Polyangiaceae bacterium]